MDLVHCVCGAVAVLVDVWGAPAEADLRARVRPRVRAEEMVEGALADGGLRRGGLVN